MEKKTKKSNTTKMKDKIRNLLETSGLSFLILTAIILTAGKEKALQMAMMTLTITCWTIIIAIIYVIKKKKEEPWW